MSRPAETDGRHSVTGGSLDRSLAELARRIHGRSYLTGQFVLRSGAQSSFYFDKYAFEAEPVLSRDIARAMLPMLPAHLDVLAGLELGGVPLATVLSQLSGVPTRFVRKHAKAYGTCRLAEGGEIAGRRVAIVEDVVTSGGQVIESARALREQGAILDTVVCVIDRQTGGAENLADEGLQLRSLFTGSHIEQAVADDPLASPDTGLHELVEAVRALSYGRSSDRTVEGMLRERRGTCSTKHLFLAQIMAERFPATRPQIVHRVYRLDRALAGELFGAQLAAYIPVEGLVDVHRYLTIILGGQRIAVDATFPGALWDGRSSLPLACGPGTDHPAGEHADAEKRALEQEHCDPSAREPFIAALGRSPRGFRSRTK
jgi:orotate phosphoribosyltransferase